MAIVYRQVRHRSPTVSQTVSDTVSQTVFDTVSPTVCDTEVRLSASLGNAFRSRFRQWAIKRRNFGVTY